jgi:hypothetical protein
VEGEKSIELLRKGDWVLARPEGEVGGTVSARRVEAVHVRVGVVVEVMLGGRGIRVTPDHPFYERSRGWVGAGTLHAGEEASLEDGGWLRVEGVRETGEEVPVYNLTVSDYHTYFVGSRSWGFAVWVHNASLEEYFAGLAKVTKPNPNLSPTRVTPGTYGLQSLVANQRELELFNQTLRELASSRFPGGNAYQRYLAKIEDAARKGVAPTLTHKEVNKAFNSVSENYLRRLRQNGLLAPGEAAELHHWNYNKTHFPLQIADPSNLYLVTGTQSEVDALHKAIHRATSASSHTTMGPIHPTHMIPVDSAHPYTPPM